MVSNENQKSMAGIPINQFREGYKKPDKLKEDNTKKI